MTWSIRGMLIRGMLLASIVVIAFGGCGSKEDSGATASVDRSGRKVLYYKSSMDPSFISMRPGKDTMGMPLSPVYEGDPGSDLDVIELTGATTQRMGLRVATLKRQTLTRIVRALGRVEFDETRVAEVNMKFDGWIEKLWVDETGQKVKKGDALFAIYSPELVATQEEYLQILKSPAVGPHSLHLRKAARQRLLQFDVPESFVRAVEKRGKALRTVTIRSPRTGYVIHKTAFKGSYVKKGANLFTVADLDALWVIADVFERDVPWVVAGQDATIELDYLPGNMQKARVDYVYPVLKKKTRTLEVRLVLPNPKVALKPGMFATVRIHTTPAGEALVVPSEAVIHSGERNVVFVAKGGGKFEPRNVTLGVMGDDVYQVLDGLSEGETVVTSGQFLLDSESRLKEAVKKMLGSNVKPAESKPGDAPDMKGMKGMKGMEPEKSAPKPGADGADAAGKAGNAGQDN